MIIGICGFQSAGKDTLGDYLVNKLFFVKLSFASLLKDIISILFSNLNLLFIQSISIFILFSLVLNTGFVVPWLWVIIGIVICSIVGLVAGIYPAMKASALNPIDALRYE